MINDAQTTDRESVLNAARAAREASTELAVRSRADKDATLEAMAAALERHTTAIVEANGDDVAAAQADGAAEAVVDRLRLDADRVTAMAAAVRDVAALVDPVGEVVRGYTLPNGIDLRQVRVPFGVVGIIYEGRPNVTVDAAALAVKSGNAVLLRGSSSARNSNTAIVEALREAATEVAMPADAIQLVPGAGHESAKHLMTARGLVDVLIPRGGAGLIRSVVDGATVPVIETGVGNCHVYVDRDADLDQALLILLNAKTQRPSVCNAAETLLVHADVAEVFLPRALGALDEAGVTVHGDEQVRGYSARVQTATADDWDTEYLTLDLAAGVVGSLEEAISHIRRHGSAHTDAIVTGSQAAARRFVAAVDSAAVVVNASTRFTDGGEFGFGAEIGISTQKLHARGPMGLTELTSTKWVITGDGQVRG